MGEALEAGRGEPGEHSLAGYLEAEFDAVRVEAGLDPLPSEGRQDRKLLFLGIARGLVRYLGDHAEAFVIESHRTVDDTQAYRHDGSFDGYVRIRVDTDVGTGTFPEHP